MKKLLIVRVELPTCNPDKPFNKVFEKQINFEGSVMVPYTSILDTLKFMCGVESYVSFIVC